MPRTLTSAHAENQPPVELAMELLRAWPLPLDADGDKHTRGTALVVAGSTTCVGPALLAELQPCEWEQVACRSRPWRRWR